MNPVVIVHRSETRRKACEACVRAKRRCDLVLPVCARCQVRGLGCGYGGGKQNGVKEQVVVSSATSSQQTMIQTTSPDTASPAWLSVPATPPADLVMVAPIEDFLPSPSPLTSFPFPEIVAVDPYQLGYCIFEIKRCVETLVLDSRTPFMHPALYAEALPEMYQDLVGMCALYMQRTARNCASVYRMLDAKVEKLIGSITSVVRIEDWLLAVQTLIMYQIIRLFDGDARQRWNAELDMALLHVWTEKLQWEFSEADIATSRRQDGWIVLESIRRTVMVSWLLRGFYESTSEGVCYIVPALTSLMVSVDSEAWDEPGGVLNENVVPYPDFVDSWNGGKVLTVSLYEMILLKACPRARIDGVS